MRPCITNYHIQGLKTAIVEGHEVGGTCVNRGCVPSKALLAASGRVRDLKNDMHLKSMGIQVSHKHHLQIDASIEKGGKSACVRAQLLGSATGFSH